MSQSLSDSQNALIGAFTGSCATATMQPTLYWKASAMAGLTFTLNPFVVYRGVGVSVFREGIEMGLQVATTGAFMKKIGGTSKYAEPAAALMAGVVIAPPLQVCECVMITQQRLGGNIFNTPKYIFQNFGMRGFFRGYLGTMSRDTLYLVGLLGTTPLLQSWLSKDCGWGQSSSEVVGAGVSGVVVGFLTCPLDGVAIGMKGDLGGDKYTGFLQALRLRSAGGLATLFSGACWRMVSISGFFVVANAIRTRAEPALAKYNESQLSVGPALHAAAF